MAKMNGRALVVGAGIGGLAGTTGDALVAFMASEKTDEKGIESVAAQAAETIGVDFDELVWRILETSL